MNPQVYLPSTWRDARGPLLTDRRIKHYVLLGRYGPEMQERARAVQQWIAKRRVLPQFKCIGCGSQDGVRFYAYSYLSEHGNFCPTCIGIERKAHEYDLELKARYREASRREYE